MLSFHILKPPRVQNLFRPDPLVQLLVVLVHPDEEVVDNPAEVHQLDDLNFLTLLLLTWAVLKVACDIQELLDLQQWLLEGLDLCLQGLA